ncbi:MAG: hypothetical protein ACJ79B_09025, partial [Gemmatimonadaceae bacterium]
FMFQSPDWVMVLNTVETRAATGRFDVGGRGMRDEGWGMGMKDRPPFPIPHPSSPKSNLLTVERVCILQRTITQSGD